MEDKRLDLDIPLLSVRRHSVPTPVKPSTKSQEPAAKPPTLSRRSAVPFYKSDLKSGPVRNPGVVPFVWEKKPGQPKTGVSPRVRPPPVPLLPPGWIPNDAGPDGSFSNPNSIYEGKPMEDAAVMASGELLKVTEVEDSFSEAVETLSRSESFLMNCSISGLSGIPDAFVPSGSFSTDPDVRNLMMDRFLPAAQAMVAGSPQCPPWKPAKVVERVENGEHRLRRVPLPYQHRPYFVARYPRDELGSSDGDDDGDYDEGSGNFASKACGLLPRLCLKNSFCLLNPVTGMKVGGRQRRLPPSTSQKIGSILHDDGPLSQAENELWEAVYKHKLRLGIPFHEEGESKSTTTKSNQHGQLSDSQTLDRSSSCCHSGGSREAFVEILKRDAKNDKSDGSESFDNDGERVYAMSTSHGSRQDSGILSPAMGNSVIVDSLLVEIPHSKHTSTDSEKGFRSLNETSESAYAVSEVIADNQRMEENPWSERHNGFVLQPQSSGIHDSDLILHSARNQSVGSLPLEVEEQSKTNSNFHFLLPPPLPKTPSESWLLRTLPSVSAKSSSGQSIFGIHTLQRKQGFYASSTPPRQESDAKTLESQHQQVPCDVVPTEQNKESSIKHSELQNEQIPDIKPSKLPRRQIRFADVLMTPLSPRSEM
ncbi:uncharacterized protein LOC110027575 [Phalaenopsis equestris]|uniref:uncharacterized protein LOC110027575 n=1 Tax=Phalaenopsis equestris TaxID=78828 RepID=UPI0009E4B544|nr:uncharacterized protein LOC110027575 [Phalaenopsis equestris]